jgi:hypothetical protein
MQIPDQNPRVSPLLWCFFLVIALVLTMGVFLFFRPAIIAPRWLWPLAPFNTRFLGAVYLTELVVVLAVLLRPRWAPVRPVLPMAFAFVTLVSLFSLVYAEKFDFARRATWGWFVVYLGPVGILGYFLWRYRSSPPVVPRPVSVGWHRYLRAESALGAGYGLALMVAPVILGAAWPWPLDAFHGRIYSSLFLTVAVGSWVIAGAAARSEFLTIGLSRIALGGFAISGVVIVDAMAHKVAWGRPGVWLWMAAFAVFAVSGVVMITAARRAGLPAPRRETSERPPT